MYTVNYIQDFMTNLDLETKQSLATNISDSTDVEWCGNSTTGYTFRNTIRPKIFDIASKKNN